MHGLSKALSPKADHNMEHFTFYFSLFYCNIKTNHPYNTDKQWKRDAETPGIKNNTDKGNNALYSIGFVGW